MIMAEKILTEKMIVTFRAKSRKDLSRRKPTREIKNRILIVCEGTKTEPVYFKLLCQHFGIPKELVEIIGTGMTPDQVLDRTEQELSRAKKKDEEFSEAFCVFDRDKHTTLSSTLNKINNKHDITHIVSSPCFELWFLLHFTATSKHYQSTPGRSTGHNLVGDLRKYLPTYDKTNVAKTFLDLITKTEVAISNSKNVYKNFLNTRQNPNIIDGTYSEVHILVIRLMKLSKE